MVKRDNSGITTIQIKKETKRKLKNLKIIPQEPYDAIINRMISKSA
jgi:hypothetical protein